MEKIKVGKIVNTHGIKGEVKIQQSGIETFDRDINYYIGDNFTEVKTVSSKFHKGFYIVKLKDFDNINDVMKFKSKEIFIDSEDLIDLEEDEFYIKDLIGLDVIDESDNNIGKLVDVLEYEANDVYEVETQNGLISIPAVDEFILEVNIEEKYLRVKIIEGM